MIVDSKSGVSGAGRSPSDKTHFCAVTENFRAYSEVGHRHTPEMIQELSQAARRALPVSFTLHLLPVERGIESDHLLPAPRWSGWRPLLAARSTGPFYANEPFVEVCQHVPGLPRSPAPSACRMTVREDTAAGVVKVFTVIDNLVKGASGQAVQNMNCMFGLRRDAGLERKV